MLTASSCLLESYSVRDFQMLWNQREVTRAGGHRIWPHILIRPQVPGAEAAGPATASSNPSTQPTWQEVEVGWMCFGQWEEALKSHPLYPCWL